MISLHELSQIHCIESRNFKTYTNRTVLFHVTNEDK